MAIYIYFKMKIRKYTSEQFLNYVIIGTISEIRCCLFMCMCGGGGVGRGCRGEVKKGADVVSGITAPCLLGTDSVAADEADPNETIITNPTGLKALHTERKRCHKLSSFNWVGRPVFFWDVAYNIDSK